MILITVIATSVIVFASVRAVRRARRRKILPPPTREALRYARPDALP